MLSCTNSPVTDLDWKLIIEKVEAKDFDFFLSAYIPFLVTAESLGTAGTDSISAISSTPINHEGIRKVCEFVAGLNEAKKSQIAQTLGKQMVI